MLCTHYNFINPRHACAARVTVLGLSFCLSFCLSVCLSGHAILAVRAIKSIMKDTIVLSIRFAAILKMAFFIKLFYSKVRAFFFFTYLGRGGHF